MGSIFCAMGFGHNLAVRWVLCPLFTSEGMEPHRVSVAANMVINRPWQVSSYTRL